MSRITFQDLAGRVEVRGSERAYMKSICFELALAVFNPQASYSEGDLAPFCAFPADTNTLRFADRFRMLLNGNSNGHFLLEGKAIPPDHLVLNTILAMRSDTLTLLARIHGQCEIHCWVDGPNRAWMADLIRQGRDFAHMRPAQGWEGLAEFLELRDDLPVVASYSVTDGFPNTTVAGIEMPDDEDAAEAVSEAFHQMSDEAQWEACMQQLRGNNRRGLELQPLRWHYPDWFFGHGATAFKILEIIDQKRFAVIPEHPITKERNPL